MAGCSTPVKQDHPLFEGGTGRTASLPDIPPFISDEPKQGASSFNWADFKRPKLRRFPGSLLKCKWKAYLGTGEDGVVLKGKTADGDFIAAKTFYLNKRPVPPRGAYCYWPFERECRNSVVLEMITTSLQRASADGKEIRVNSQPVTRRDALHNLKRFSADYPADETPPRFQPINPNPDINPCLGWTVVNGGDIDKIICAFREISTLQEGEDYFVIVYRYVPRGELSDVAIQTQLDFFYRVGFSCEPVEARNWRGSGTLVDFSDLISPHAPEWEEFRYGRMVKTELGFYDIKRRDLGIVSETELTASQQRLYLSY